MEVCFNVRGLTLHSRLHFHRHWRFAGACNMHVDTARCPKSSFSFAQLSLISPALESGASKKPYPPPHACACRCLLHVNTLPLNCKTIANDHQLIFRARCTTFICYLNRAPAGGGPGGGCALASPFAPTSTSTRWTMGTMYPCQAWHGRGLNEVPAAAICGIGGCRKAKGFGKS
jgi:hypothetical protein